MALAANYIQSKSEQYDEEEGEEEEDDVDKQYTRADRDWQ